MYAPFVMHLVNITFTESLTLIGNFSLLKQTTLLKVNTSSEIAV